VRPIGGAWVAMAIVMLSLVLNADYTNIQPRKADAQE
jgi:hypothetical protein